jgi:hypothetical protein
MQVMERMIVALGGIDCIESPAPFIWRNPRELFSSSFPSPFMPASAWADSLVNSHGAAPRGSAITPNSLRIVL